jgi:hypothetical protein
LAYLGLSPHLKEKLESYVFFYVSQVLQRAHDCESRAKESRNFPRSSDKHRSECHVNMVEYSNESSDDEEADMCVAEWSWVGGAPNLNNLYALALSQLLKVGKMRCATLSTSLNMIGSSITCCRKNKLNYQVIMLYLHRNSSKNMRIVNGIIIILMLLMIAIFSIDRFNQPKMKDD